MFLARVLWLQGFADQAVRTAEMSIGEAQATGHAMSLCYALALAACPIALWVGNLAAAAHYTGMLLDHSRKHGLPLWSAFGSRFQRVVVLKGGDLDTGSRLLRTGLDEIVEPNFSFRFLTGLSELAEALAHAGRIAEALALLEAGIEQSEAGWLTPELLRLKGELLLLQSTPAVAETAEDLFRQALDGARQQEALSWELRAATSLARLLRNQGRPADAIACLQPVYDRFTEGFGTADLIAAKQLLDELGGGGLRSDPGEARVQARRRELSGLPYGRHAISFGPFRLLAAQRLLLEGDKPVRLGSRAFDILAALVERAGEVVGKEELIARAWPQTFVEEANLEDPGQRLAPRPRRRPRRPSLRRHRSGTRLQFRRPGHAWRSHREPRRRRRSRRRRRTICRSR